jgi:predicted lipoprotein with Yx(FWY)xxD motif
MRKLLLLTITTAALGGLVATAEALATGSATTSAYKAAVVKISTRKLPKLGTILVNSKGLTLYMFVPDKRKKVTCVHACAVIWPPVKLAKGEKAVAAGKVETSLLASDPDPAGGRVVTYNKWPLYTYITDKKPEQATGQALNLNGGLWYVLNPAGKVIKTKLTR